MFTEMLATGSGGGGVRAVTLRHQRDALTIYSGVNDLTTTEMSQLEGATPDTHSASNSGGSFDFTVTVDASTSVRFHSPSTSYSDTYLYADLIKNGTTVSSNNVINVPDALYSGYYVSVVV